MAEATLPALNSNNRSTRFNDIESERVAQTKSDAIIDLIVSQTLENLPGKSKESSHRSATGGLLHHEARNTRMDSNRGADEFALPFARYE